MRRSSAMGTSRFMSGEADVASNSRPGLPAHVRDSMLKGQGTRGQDARGGATRHGDRRVGQAMSSCPWQLHLRGTSCRGMRKCRSSSTRNWALGMVTSSCVGKTLKTRPAKGPACESSSARDAGEVSKMRLIRALITSTGGTKLPAFEAPRSGGFLRSVGGKVDGGRRQQQPNRGHRSRLGASVPARGLRLPWMGVALRR